MDGFQPELPFQLPAQSQLTEHMLDGIKRTIWTTADKLCVNWMPPSTGPVLGSSIQVDR